MKGKKVFVVVINEVSEFEQFDHDPEVYEEREKARELLAKARQDAINEYLDEEDEDSFCTIDKDTPDYFALYDSEQGWSHTHYEVSITECEIQ